MFGAWTSSALKLWGQCDLNQDPVPYSVWTMLQHRWVWKLYGVPPSLSRPRVKEEKCDFILQNTLHTRLFSQTWPQQDLTQTLFHLLLEIKMGYFWYESRISLQLCYLLPSVPPTHRPPSLSKLRFTLNYCWHRSPTRRWIITSSHASLLRHSTVPWLSHCEWLLPCG